MKSWIRENMEKSQQWQLSWPYYLHLFGIVLIVDIWARFQKQSQKSFLKATDNSDFLVQLKPRPDPVLTVSVSKLKYQRRYDLLHGKKSVPGLWTRMEESFRSA